MKTKNEINLFFALILSALVFSIGIFFLESNLLLTIEEDSEISWNYLFYLGISTVVSIFVITEIRKFVNIKNRMMQSWIIVPIIIIGLLVSLYVFASITVFSFIILSLVYAFFIITGAEVLSNLTKSGRSKKVLDVIGGAVGGIIAGIFVSLIFLLRINFSIDEGFFLLTASMLSIIGAMMGTVIFIVVNGSNLIFKSKLNFGLEINLVSAKQKTIFLLIILLVLIGISSNAYWESLNLNDESSFDFSSINEDSSICFDTNRANSVIESSINKKMLIKLLENKPQNRLDVMFQLYLLTNDSDYLSNFKDLLLLEAKERKFVGISNSAKGWQYEAMFRPYYYLLSIENNPDLFDNSERKIVLDWFKELNEHVHQVSWVDYVYAFAFKKLPDGPYESQEIGIGLLTLLSEVLKDEYPELVQKNTEYIKNFGKGWKNNFRNPDDEIVYAQQVWIKNAFLMSEFGTDKEFLVGKNSKNSFEWVLQQWPPTGISPAYNVALDRTPFDIMMLGGYLHNDGRYVWLADKMLGDELRNIERDIDFILGPEYLQSDIKLVEPEVGSCYIKGPTGIAQKLGPLRPDKIVFRDGWNEDSLYMLLNLRFAGWHSYKATNSFVTLIYGEPFVVEELDLISHKWLPKGKADHRDKKINREQLNGLLIQIDGLEKIIYKITGIGSAWHQDPPRFSDVLFFGSTPTVDYAKTRISNWHGWTHDRVSILVKDEYFVVIDNVLGANKEKVGLIWNLKGIPTFQNNKIKLTNGDYSLNIHYPHLDSDYQVKVMNQTDEYSPAGNIHDSDMNLLFVSENTNHFGATTVFYPERNGVNYTLEKIEPLNYNNEFSYPNAFGIKISSDDKTQIIGAGFDFMEHKYDQIKTDSDFFVAKIFNQIMEISFKNAKKIEVSSDITPSIILLNGNELKRNQEWTYSNSTIIISPVTNEGYIEIKW